MPTRYETYLMIPKKVLVQKNKKSKFLTMYIVRVQIPYGLGRNGPPTFLLKIDFFIQEIHLICGMSRELKNRKFLGMAPGQVFQYIKSFKVF